MRTSSRIAAIVVGAVAITIVVAVISTAMATLTCAPACRDAVNVRFVYNLVWIAPLCFVSAAISGTLALTLTPAKAFPWQSLPALIVGTLIGFLACLLLASLRFGSVLAWPAPYFVLPVLAGVTAAWNVGRLPRPFGVRSGDAAP